MEKSFSLINFTENEIRPHANEIDANKLVLKGYLRTLVLEISDSVDLKSELPQNSDLESLFGASTALAFVFWQHLAVLERLQ